MPTQLHDDGQTVTLDLHGTTIDEAVALTQRTVQLAAQRGRAHVKVIHGTSTSSILYPNRTIKHALHALLDQDTLDPYVTSDWRTENHLLLALDLTTSTDPTPLRLYDVMQ